MQPSRRPCRHQRQKVTSPKPRPTMIKRRALLWVVFVPAGTAREVLAYRLSEAGTLATAAHLGQSRAMGPQVPPEAG